MRSVKLVFWSAVAYGALLVIVRGALPQGPSQTISLLGIPLLIVAIIIARDLAGRSTNPTMVKTESSKTSLRDDPVALLSNQIRVAASASDSYFDLVVRARLKDLLIDKVALETGLEKDTVRQSLFDKQQALQLLRNRALYDALNGPVPATGPEKVNLINRAIDMIGAWNG